MNLTKIIFLLFVTILSVSSKQDRVRLKNVEALTLYSDRWTTSRRSAPVKQLTCVGGSCNGAQLQAAQCYNRGFDGNDVQWECKADLPSNYKFGRLEVSCEGYEYPDDDYILAGSCGLEYTIEDISKSSNSYYSSFRNLSNHVDGEGSSWLTIVVIIAAAIALYFYFRPNNTTPPTSIPRPGPSPGPNPSDPPPPYGFRSDYQKTSQDSYNASGASTGPSTGTSNGPGFFSGMAAGGFLGYLFGNNRGNNGYARRGYQENSFWNNPSSSSYSSGYSSFSRPSFSGGGGSSNSRTSTSTGFASTKRR